jgi:hypothetical protein
MIDRETGSLNLLLGEFCRMLQLSPSQHASAVEKYDGVGRWLGGSGSPLEPFATSIYAQGSMAIGTTVKPLEDTEHDLDLIFEVDPIDLAPAELHRIVEERLKQNQIYAQRLVVPAPARCLRLKYAGDFHLDIVPARRDPERGVTAIEVPDRELRCWVPNNPKEYQRWFEGRAVSLVIMEKAAVQPVPALMASDQKPPLKRVVQLMKRHRDITFGSANGAPSSILITTMAARFYRGDLNVADALLKVLTEIEKEIRSFWPDRVSIANPTNSAEDLCSRFSDQQYADFAHWAIDFSDQFRKLRGTSGIEKTATALKSLFGEKITTNVVKAYIERLDETRRGGGLRYGASGLAATRGIAAPQHTFHGEE